MTRILARSALTPEGWQQDICLEIGSDGRIVAIGSSGPDADIRADLVLPAAVNLHSHAFQRAMAGLTERRGATGTDSFWTWRRLMYRFLDRLDPEMVEAITALAFMEMAEAGYGAVAEFHYLHHAPNGVPYQSLGELSERIVAASAGTGLGLALLPVAYSQGGCDGRPLEGGQRRFGNDLERYVRLFEEAERMVSNAAPDTGIGVAPHSLRAVPRDDLARLSGFRPDAPIHMHLAEQVAEVDEVQATYGARPVEWFLNELPAGERWCLIHTTQMTAEETADLAASGAVAGLCPITESSLGDGIFDGVSYLSQGGRFGIGTDSNIDISAFSELATLEYSQRLRDRSRAALAGPGVSVGRRLYEGALSGGAQAAGRDSGRLASGAWADIVAVRADDPRMIGRTEDTALDALIFGGAGRSAVTDVWSAGRHIVRDGRHVAREGIVGRYAKAMSALGDAL